MSEHIVKGYKVFGPDWTCRDKHYTCPGRFEEDVEPSVCNRGIHFCRKAADCFNYYSFDPNYKVAEVVAYGKVAENGDKCATDKLEIVREIPWSEVLELVNTGKGCTGIGNIGSHNSGWRNSGSYNSGSHNSGWHNSGSDNSGSHNSGSDNSGSHNSGSNNSGDWNKTNHSSGCFNTVEQKIYLFNKPSEWTYEHWERSEARSILEEIPHIAPEWVNSNNMTKKEKQEHPDHEITGGYLKTFTTSQRAKNAMAWWRKLSKESRSLVMSIPNFDKEIFKEITGIDVDAVPEGTK